MNKWKIAATVMAVIGMGCGLQVPQPSGGPGAHAPADRIDVLSISAASYSGATDAALEMACHEWRLSPAQAAGFFELATRYAAPPYSGFYFIPCSIDGELMQDGKRWKFSIGGAGTAVWRAGDVTVHWGCSAPGCARLLLLPADGMAP